MNISDDAKFWILILGSLAVTLLFVGWITDFTYIATPDPIRERRQERRLDTLEMRIDYIEWKIGHGKSEER